MGRTISEFTRDKRAIANEMAKRIAHSLDPDRILLFGSVARGQAREASDVDLMVVADSDLSFKDRMDLLYTRIERGEEIDMLWYTPQELDRMKRTSSFVRHALEEGVLLYERGT